MRTELVDTHEMLGTVPERCHPNLGDGSNSSVDDEQIEVETGCKKTTQNPKEHSDLLLLYEEMHFIL